MAKSQRVLDDADAVLLVKFNRDSNELVRELCLSSYSPMQFGKDHKSTISEVFYKEADVRQVDVPSFSGAFGILPNHVPTLAVLKPGVLTVFEADGALKKFFVSSGMISINDDSSVQILAEEAVTVESLDLSSARDILSKANSEVSSASSDAANAEAMIAVEVAEALVKAAESA